MWGIWKASAPGKKKCLRLWNLAGQMVGCMCVGMNVWSWTSERSLPLTICNWYELVVNFGNTWTKQKWNILSPAINEETWDRTTTRMNMSILLLPIDCLYWGKWGPGILESGKMKGSWKKVSQSKEDVLDKGRWRFWLEERSCKWGKILETRGLCGGGCWGTPRDLGH